MGPLLDNKKILILTPLIVAFYNKKNICKILFDLQDLKNTRCNKTFNAET